MLRNSDHSFGLVAIVLHWAVALLFAGELALGFAMSRVSSMALQFTLIQWHKSFGFGMLVVALVRIGWALSGPRPDHRGLLSRNESIAAAVVQTMLYGATIVVALAGWALVSTSTLGIPTLAFNRWLVPDLPLARSGSAEAAWREIHALVAYGSGLLAIGHAAAAMRHHFVMRDAVLRRMLWPRQGRTRRQGIGLE